MSDLVYFDYGTSYPQLLYVPMYLTSGSAKAVDGSTIRVLTLFPAVSMEELIKTGALPVSEEAINTTQKHSTFTFTPKPPPATAGGTGSCPGNTVDYTVTCTANGVNVCSAFIGVDPKDDPLDVCEKGCQNSQGTVQNAAGQDPCRMFLQQKNIPLDRYNPYTPNSGFPTGPSNCTINACPC